MEKIAPVIFVGHGSPTNAIGDNPNRVAWKLMDERLGKPKVIIAVSAHWMTDIRCVRRAEDNPQVFDMYGFPEELYHVEYSPVSDLDIADEILKAIPNAKIDNNWGIDHGIWSVLSNMYPSADVPVIMASVTPEASPQAQFEAGQKLASLRKEGAMILCSGNVVHNLSLVNWRMEGGYGWADDFDFKIRDLILDGNIER